LGEPLANGFLALTRKPPSTRSTAPLEAIQSLAPVLMRIASLAATFSSSFWPGLPLR
jgi:hypothetical protein